MVSEGIGPGATGGRAIFLHGYPGHPTEFVSLATQLDTSCELLEMPWLDASASKLALMDIVKALGRDFLETPTHIVGHDLGAVVGWFLAHLEPRHVQSLTMIGTPRLDVYQANLKQLGARGYLDYQQVLANHNTDSPLPDQMELAGAETEDVHLAKRLLDNRSLTNPLAISSLYRSLAVCPIPPRDDVRGVPLLNIMGGNDPYFPSVILKDSNYVHPLRGNTVILEDAGHWPHYTHTNSCKAALNRFWRGIA